MSIKETIRQEIDIRRQHMVEELMGHEENCKYHYKKGMHDAYVDILTYLDYSVPNEQTGHSPKGVRREKTAFINGQGVETR